MIVHVSVAFDVASPSSPGFSTPSRGYPKTPLSKVHTASPATPQSTPRPRATPNTSVHGTPGSAKNTPLRGAAGRSDALALGDKVMVGGNFGWVRFIGETTFADGLWLGVELENPVGKNDGTVDDKRYFTSQPQHGLFVRPNKATRRGITCSSLL